MSLVERLNKDGAVASRSRLVETPASLDEQSTLKRPTIPWTHNREHLDVIHERSELKPFLHAARSTHLVATTGDRSIPLPRRTSGRQYQLVSWLAALALLTAFPISGLRTASQWLCWEKLAAYSCGVSHGLSACRAPYRVPCSNDRSPERRYCSKHITSPPDCQRRRHRPSAPNGQLGPLRQR